MRLYKTAVRVDARDPAIRDFNVGDTGLLVYFHAFAVGPARISPRHGIVAGDGPRRVVERTDDGRLVPAAVQVDLGDGLLDELRADDFGIDAEVLVDLGAPALGAQRGRRVRQGEVAALGVEQVVVELPRQIAVQIHAELVKARTLFRQVIRADDRRVAASAAVADVALL